MDGQTIGAEDWTQGPLTVTVSAETQGYVLQTSQDGTNWKTGETGKEEIEENTKIASQETKQITSRATTRSTKQTSSQTFITNGTLYARLFDPKTNKAGKVYTKPISNIDKKDPTIKEDETQISATTNSITITASAKDEESGIAKYSFSRDDGVNWEWNPTEGVEEGQTEATYTFNNLITQTYNLKIKVTDEVGNEATSGTIPQATEPVPGGKDNIGMDGLTKSADIEIDYEYANWTNGNVDITLTNKTGNDDYDIFYSKDGGAWTKYEDTTEKITFEKNGTIVAKLIDKAGNEGAIATGNVMKIDKLEPIIESITATSTHNSITVTASATDQAATTEYACSGIDEEEGYRFKLGDGNWTDYQASGEYTFNSSLNKDTNYTITVEAKDAAENTTEKTKAIYTVTYDANGGEGAPEADTKIEGTDLTLNTTTVPTKKGYTFKGWGTSQTATDVVTTYSENANTTFYAIYSLTFSHTSVRAATDIPNDKGTIFSYLPSNVRVTLKSNESYCSSGWSGIDNIYINNEAKSKEFTIKKDPNGLAPDEYTLTVDSGEGRLVLF